MDISGLFLYIGVPGLIFVIATALLGVYKKQRRGLKYLPAILAAVISLAFLIKAYVFSEGFKELGYAIMMMVSAVVFIISIITALLLEIINSRR